MNKILLLIFTLLGADVTMKKEHLDFRPEISTTIAKIVMSSDEIPVFLQILIMIVHVIKKRV